MAIWHHEDWSLYGLDKYQVQEKIMELNLKGGYIAQCSGELLTISWNYQTMEEFIKHYDASKLAAPLETHFHFRLKFQ